MGWQQQVIVITGSIGSGKSTVAEIFRSLGGTVFSADTFARETTAPNSPLLGEIRKEFGDGVFNSDGSLDRKSLGAIIFADRTKKTKLEQILHPAIHQLAEINFSAAIAQHKAPLFYECPLFFEAKLDKENFKKVIVVSCNQDLAINRIMTRDSLSYEQARQRLENQLPISEKKSRTDYIIENQSDKKILEKSCKELYAEITSEKF